MSALTSETFIVFHGLFSTLLHRRHEKSGENDRCNITPTKNCLVLYSPCTPLYVILMISGLWQNDRCNKHDVKNWKKWWNYRLNRNRSKTCQVLETLNFCLIFEKNAQISPNFEILMRWKIW